VQVCVEHPLPVSCKSMQVEVSAIIRDPVFFNMALGLHLMTRYEGE
jgi:hypothetical protein